MNSCHYTYSGMNTDTFGQANVTKRTNLDMAYRIVVTPVIMKSTKVQTLGELRIRGSTN